MSFPPIVIDREATFAAVRPLLTAAWWSAFTSDHQAACDAAAAELAEVIHRAYQVGTLESTRAAVEPILTKHDALGFDDPEAHWQLDRLLRHLFGLPEA